MQSAESVGTKRIHTKSNNNTHNKNKEVNLLKSREIKVVFYIECN